MPEAMAASNDRGPSSGAEPVTGLTVVIPCYNEARRLRIGPFADALAANPDWRLLFVNDGSTDDTASVVSVICAATPSRAECIDLPRNRGKAEAVRQGVLHAIQGRPGFIAFLDADLSTPLEALAGLYQAARDSSAIVVCGSRVRLLGLDIQRNPLRHYFGRVFATCASLVLHQPIYDTQCGAKVFRNDPALRAVFDRPFRVNWTFDVELLARVLIRFGRDNKLPGGGHAVVERPLTVWSDVAGSNVRPWDFFRGLYELLAIARSLRDPNYRGLFQDPAAGRDSA